MIFVWCLAVKLLCRRLSCRSGAYLNLLLGPQLSIPGLPVGKGSNLIRFAPCPMSEGREEKPCVS